MSSRNLYKIGRAITYDPEIVEIIDGRLHVRVGSYRHAAVLNPGQRLLGQIQVFLARILQIRQIGWHCRLLQRLSKLHGG